MQSVDLAPLLTPRSVAILGASERPSVGRAIIRSLERLGFEGTILPVNPKYDTVLGHPCHASLAALPQAPDVVAFCVGRDRTLDNVRAMAQCGARAAVVYGGGYGEAGAEGRAVQAEIAAICRDAGIALMGPNCMGGVSPWHRSSTYMSEFSDTHALAGHVGFVSQSGSITLGMLIDLRRFGFSHLVSSGNEAVVTAADYVDFLVDDTNTKVIALFLEAANDPDHFVAALDRAADAGKPVVVLKVGRSARAQRSVTSHTGALAGSAAVFSQVLRAHRAIEVRDIEGMTEVLSACRGEAWPRGRRIAVVTASGGQAELILDIAADADIDVPKLPDAARAAIEAVTGRLTGDGNPTDAWGSGEFVPALAHTLKVLAGTGAYDAMGLCMDTGEYDVFEDRVVLAATAAVADAGRASGIPHFVLGTRPGQMRGAQLDLLHGAGQVFLTGIRPGLQALDRLARWSMHERVQRLPGVRAAAAGGAGWEDAASRPSIHEHDAKRLLAAAGMPVTREHLVHDLAQARGAAYRIGYPVVLKGVGDNVPHKTELGLVYVAIADDAGLAAAWARIEAARSRLTHPEHVSAVLVQEMVPRGIEVIAGIARDPQFGLTLSFGLGGTLVEILRDTTLRLVPLVDGDAEAMIADIRASAAFAAVRGAPPADVQSLASCLYALSDFAHANADRIEEIDVNPILVMPQGQGCRIVDALIVPRRTSLPEQERRTLHG
jgi:acyl-CoA synthetase (NDP forming)